ncbi:MAG TPA: endopeptidase La [Burkholderiales bacterium]|nr:endopeptidase La [Burkholderiales bacterium]
MNSEHGNANRDSHDNQALVHSGDGPTNQFPVIPEDALILIPVRNLVLFPGLLAPIAMGLADSVTGGQVAQRHEIQVGIILQSNSERDEPGPDDLYRVGTTADILRYVTVADGAHHMVCQGEQRFRILKFLEGYPFPVARIERIREAVAWDTEIEALMLQLKQRANEVARLMPQSPEEFRTAIQGMNAPGMLADFIASVMDIRMPDKQDILETFDLRSRLEKVLTFLNRRIQVLQVSQEIGQQTKDRMDEQQRHFLLREQLKTIQKELGDTDINAMEIAELDEAIAKAGMPQDVEAQARKELRRLERMPDSSAEYSMLRTYLEWMIELPWSKTTEGEIDIPEAARILDEDHFGLEKIKRRILEFLAVRKLNPQGKGAILCFAGPPGVGKTSLGQSIAKATGRKFARISLGGVHDEAEIRGHRRTYIGAMSGNIIQAIRKAGARDALVMLDEIDKLGAGLHGDPSSALLEVLDPEQNGTFRDNYLGVPFDLSKVMFIATANMLDTIPGPLRDRMEVIQLPGYTEEEKAQIARRYLVKRQLEANGVKPEQSEITDDALHTIIRDYTREAGVRNLERLIGSVFRRVAMRIAEGSATHVKIDTPDLSEILGPRKFESELAMRVSVPGIATGLAWTPVGGDILFIEASRTPGNGKLILTGQLGDVMKESAQAALTLVKARAADFNIPLDLFDKSDIHVHVPAGAVPKDGPSAGVAMFIAITSLAMNKPVRNDRAMTGEISLRGLVLPVGGVKEKVLGALRAGINTVLLPKRNEGDREEIPEQARNQLQFIWLETVDDALHAAIAELPA